MTTVAGDTEHVSDDDWTKTPGRVLGCWLSLIGLILATPFPYLAFIPAVIGFGMSLRALNDIPKGAKGRRLTVAGSVWGAVAILAVVVPDVIRFASR